MREPHGAIITPGGDDTILIDAVATAIAPTRYKFIIVPILFVIIQ